MTLKPCPFCGSTNVDTYLYATGSMSVECLDCKCRSAICEGKNEAIDAWNTRVSE